MDDSDFIAAEAKARDLQLLYIEQVKDTSSLISSMKVIAITDKELLVFKPNENQVNKSFIWLDTVKYITEKDTCTIKFNKGTFKFKADNFSRITSSIEIVLSRLFSPIEISNICLSIKSSPSLSSAIYRTKVTQPEILKIVERHARIGSSSIKIKSSDFDKYSQILPLIRTIISLKLLISNENQNQLNVILQFLRTESNLKHLLIEGHSNHILDIITAVAENSNSQIEAITFKYSEFNKDIIPKVTAILSKCSCQSITLNDAFIDNENSKISTFVDSLQVTPRFFNIVVTGSLSPSLFNTSIVVLSLEYIGIEISDIFKAISDHSNQLKSLRVLNVSGNNAQQSMPKRTNFPYRLVSVFASGIVWGRNRLQSFLSLLFNGFERGLKLSIDHAEIEGKDWSSVFNYLESCSFSSLIALNWSGNKVNKQFFSFISRNVYISTLDLSEIFKNSERHDIGLLKSYLSKNKGLGKIILRGSSDNNLGQYTSAMLKIIHHHPSIFDVDLSMNKGGDAIYQVINDIISDPDNIKRLSIDGNSPTSILIVDEMANQLFTGSRPPLLIYFPIIDMERLTQSPGLVSIGNDVKTKFAEGYSKKAAAGPFNQPIKLKVLQYSSVFPRYLLKEDIDEITAAPLIPEHDFAAQLTANEREIAERISRHGPTIKFDTPKSPQKSPLKPPKPTPLLKPAPKAHVRKQHTTPPETIPRKNRESPQKRGHHTMDEYVPVQRIRKTHKRREPPQLAEDGAPVRVLKRKSRNLSVESPRPSLTISRALTLLDESDESPLKTIDRPPRRHRIKSNNDQILTANKNSMANDYNPQPSSRKHNKPPKTVEDMPQKINDSRRSSQKKKIRKAPYKFDFIPDSASDGIELELQTERPNKYLVTQDDDNLLGIDWRFPTYPRPSPESKWSDLNQQFAFDNLVEDIEATKNR